MAKGAKFFRLWKKVKEHKMKRVPHPIWIALEIMKERYNVRAMEDVIYMIIKRDPEAREIIKYVVSGDSGVRLKGEPTLEEEINSED